MASHADDWYDEWLARVAFDHRRRTAIHRERYERPWDHTLRAEREYDDKTEHLLRMLRHEEKRSA